MLSFQIYNSLRSRVKTEQSAPRLMLECSQKRSFGVCTKSCTSIIYFDCQQPLVLQACLDQQRALGRACICACYCSAARCIMSKLEKPPRRLHLWIGTAFNHQMVPNLRVVDSKLSDRSSHKIVPGCLSKFLHRA